MSGIEGFELPQKVDVEISEVNEFGVPLKATFTTEPWAHGFGNTIGNALRRVLLSSMEGVAVSSILIPKVAHEFSSIPDVLEDVMDIILNIKKLKFTCDGETPHSVELYADKAGPVTGANIREDGIVTVLNKDQIICTLDTDRQFEMHLELDRGKGYRPSELNKRDDQPIGTIPVDSIYTPVLKVNYFVENTRVGNQTDFDKLTIEVWTDKTMSARDALSLAAKILCDHFTLFTDLSDIAGSGTTVVETVEQEPDAMLKMTIEELDLSFSFCFIWCFKHCCLLSLATLRFSDLRSQAPKSFRRVRIFKRAFARKKVAMLKNLAKKNVDLLQILPGDGSWWRGYGKKINRDVYRFKLLG